LLLAFLLLAFAIRMTKSIIYNFADGHDVPQLLQNFGYGANLAIPPLLWLYLKAFLLREYRLNMSADFIHLLPSVSVLVLSPVITSYFWMEQHGYTYSLLLMGAYLPFCYHLIYRNFAGLNKFQRRWILGLTMGVTIVWGGYTANFVFHLIPYITAPVMFSVVVYFMSYLALKHNNLFTPRTTNATSPYSWMELERCFEKLQHLMQEEQPFKDPSYTLPKAAKLLNVSTHVLSAAINKKSCQNFPEFVNNYRIKEAQLLLIRQDHSHQKIATIAFEVGFNSLSSFNAAFRKVTSMTPSEFRKQSHREN
jgi:AraC-like DNA-binding protein